MSVEVPVIRRGHEASDDKLRRFIELTKEMTQNAAGIVGLNAAPVEPSPSD